MTAYRKKWKKRRYKYNTEERRRYWDEKTLENPDVIPGDFEYHVPETEKPDKLVAPEPESVGLTAEMITIVQYHRDRNSEVPKSFEPNFLKPFLESLKYLALSVIGGVIAYALSSDQKVLAGLISIYVFAGVIWIIISICEAIGNPIKAARARMNFKKLKNETSASPLFAGKNLGQVESAINELNSKVQVYQAEVLAKAESYRKECEERTAEINRSHQEHVERLRVSAELERLKQEAHADAAKYEEENFPILALNPGYWQTGTAAQKGIRLEKKFSKLLTDAGFTVSTTAISGDDGIDIIAERRGERIVIQCKNHASKVGSPEVRDFMGALSIEQKKHPGTNGWIVSVSGFSQPTLEKYDSLGLVELWDFSDIHNLVVETYKKHDIKKVDGASGEFELE